MGSRYILTENLIADGLIKALFINEFVVFKIIIMKINITRNLANNNAIRLQQKICGILN